MNTLDYIVIEEPISTRKKDMIWGDTVQNRKKSMKRIIWIIVLLTLTGMVCAETAPEEEWRRRFGGTDTDWASSVQQTSDGGYIIAGATRSYGAGRSDFWLVKTDSNGTLEWDKTFGGGDIDLASSVQQTSDGGYIIAGATRSYGAGRSDFWLVKTDSNGNKTWNKTFGEDGWNVAYSVRQTSDDGYILVGTTESYSYDAGGIAIDFRLVKTDSNGTKEWDRIVEGTEMDTAHSVQQTYDGGYILMGTAESCSSPGGCDIWIAKPKFDSNGNWTWNNTLERADWNVAHSVQQTLDGGYVLAGTLGSYGAGDIDFRIVKTDSNGCNTWDKTFGGKEIDTAHSVQQTSDGGYILAGTTESYGAGSSDFWIVKTDSNGNKTWNKTFGGTEIDTAHSVQQTSDGGYILAGTTTSYGAGGADFWLVKTDSDGNEEWDKTFGGTGDDGAYYWASSVQQTSDGGYIFAGTTTSHGAGDNDFWLVKIKVTETAPLLVQMPTTEHEYETTRHINIKQIKVVGGTVLILITVILIPVLIVGKSRGKRQGSSDKGGHTTVKRPIGIVKHASEGNNPEIRLNFPKETFQPDIWKRINVTITNTGSVYAKEIEIKPSGDIEFRQIPTIPHLGTGETETTFITMKSMVIGDVPVDVIIEYKDAFDRNYTSSEEVWVTVVELTPPTEPTSTKQLAQIEIKRGYEVLPNNDLKFGIRITNNSDYLIADVETILDYPTTLFSLKGDTVQTLANIHPNGERTAKYVLTPLGCTHNEKIDATIIYRDHTGKRRTVQMQGKEVHCVCPFLREKALNEGEFAELAAESGHIEEGLSFSGIGVYEAAAFIKESCTHRLSTVGEHEIDNTIVLNLAGESIGEKAYYLLTAVVQPYKEKDIAQIALRAYSDKPHGLHGFLNEIIGSIRHLVGSVQSAREVGIIEEKQVINIIDSVVQRTSFGAVGAGGSTDVNIEDSVVHRSDVGSGDSDSREVTGQKRGL